MISSFINYLKWGFKAKHRWVDSELLKPTLSGAAAACRLSLGVACVVFFATWYSSLQNWISSDGPLNVDAARFLILDGVEGSGSAYRISPLYWTESFAVQVSLLLIGTLLSLVLVSGFGGRIVPILVWLTMLCVLQRVSMIQSLGDVLLCSLVPYLAIDNGWLTQRTRVGFADNEERWTTGLTIGLIRWHLLIWLSVSLGVHLSQDMWWNGDAIWNIAANGQSPILWPKLIADQPWLSPLLGNAWLLLQLLTIVCIIVRKLRPLGIAVSICYWLNIYILSGDMFYALVGMAATSAIFYESSFIVDETASVSLEMTRNNQSH